MKASKEILNFNKLVNLFFLFVVGTISLWIYYTTASLQYKNIDLRFPIFLIAIFCYEFVLASLLFYYIALAKERSAEFLKKHKKIQFIIIVSMLGLTYVVINTFVERSMLIFLRDLVLVAFMIIATPKVGDFITKKLEKWTNKKLSINKLK